MFTIATLPKILVVTHGAAATGFSRVADGIISNLLSEYNFYQFATNHRKNIVEGRWPIFGNPNDMDAYGLDRLTELIDLIQPQIILIMNDLWFFCMHLPRLTQKANRPVLIGYCPVDGKLTRPDLYKGIAHLDQIVAYTNFGATELRKVLDSVDHKQSAHLGHDIHIIPHGVDTDTFFPLDQDSFQKRNQAKQIWFHNKEDSDGFIVLNASKHQPRKRIDLTIEGFAKFAKDKPQNVKLYLHTGATFDGPDIRVLAQKAGILERLLISPGWLQDHPAVNDEQLNLLYNACDVGINTSMGEGWGLVSFEHAATGAPQIIPNHSACTELWSQINTLLPTNKEMEHKGLGMIWSEIDPTDIANVLQQLYTDKLFYQSQAEKSYNIALKEIYNWQNIASRWDDLFKYWLSR